MASHKGKKKRREKRYSKASNQVAHAKGRFLQRFGIDLSNADYEAMVQQIRTGKATFIGKQSNRVSKFWVRVPSHDLPLPVVYDKMRGTVVTVLRAEWVQPCNA